MIVYEYPLHERIRTWLRLEDLFDKALFFIRAADARSHHAALLAIFELIDVTARAEMKSELIQELERQRASLEALRSNPAVDTERLNGVLARINRALAELHAMSGKIGQHIRDNEWLMLIKGRSAIPGGVCSFDLPTYHYWLYGAQQQRSQDLTQWLAPLMPLKSAVDVVLDLLRKSGQASRHEASRGQFQLMLGGRSAHLVRVGLADTAPCAPEVCANKYAINIRFLTLDSGYKPRVCEDDLAFELTFCNL
ncbi:MAG: cell division protein ZapD [Thiobacillaceae bacterium]|nr:cell division protein ZapD [Thiobacillaceae bacterium]